MSLSCALGASAPIAEALLAARARGATELLGASARTGSSALTTGSAAGRGRTTAPGDGSDGSDDSDDSDDALGGVRRDQLARAPATSAAATTPAIGQENGLARTSGTDERGKARVAGSSSSTSEGPGPGGTTLTCGSLPEGGGRLASLRVHSPMSSRAANVRVTGVPPKEAPAVSGDIAFGVRCSSE